MIVARFRIRLPPSTWIADLSESYPDATFRLLSGLRGDETAIELGEVQADDPAAVGDAIADHASIVAYETLDRTDERVLGRYETTDTGLYEFVADSSLPIEYPVVVQNGWYEFDLTGTREELDRFTAALDEIGRSYELLSLVHGESATELLTDRQQEVLTTALRMGYFEIPRACPLADVAAELDVDKSTASRVLRRGQTQIVRWFLTAATNAR